VTFALPYVDTDLSGKVARVTGAAGALGSRFAATPASCGAAVALADVRSEQLHGVQSELEAARRHLRLGPGLSTLDTEGNGAARAGSRVMNSTFPPAPRLQRRNQLGSCAFRVGLATRRSRRPMPTRRRPRRELVPIEVSVTRPTHHTEESV
jgi:NAD(P)-dependent dehydrogenase (short-subunit alcohol dehydrogenase family)